MHRIVASLLIVLVALPGPAAAATRPAEQDIEVLRQYAGKLPIGAVVKVRLRDGARLKGILMAADQEGVVVKPKTRIPEPERRLPYANIDLLELDRPGTSVAKAIGIGVAAGAGTFLGILLLLFAAYDD